MQINLLPWRTQYRTANKKELIQIFLFSLLIVLLILWSWHWLLTYQLAQQNKAIVLLNTNIASHIQQDQTVSLLITKKQLLMPILCMVLLPAGVLLVQLKWEDNHILLTGKTTSTAAVNLLIHHLQTLTWLTNPQIQEINNNAFTISAKINA